MEVSKSEFRLVLRTVHSNEGYPQVVGPGKLSSKTLTAAIWGVPGAWIDDLVGSLTPLRLELIQATAEHTPESMREAARLVDRDISDVHSDLKQLEVLGILELEDGSAGGAMQPVVPFDRIEMHIDYPLVDGVSADSDETAASA